MTEVLPDILNAILNENSMIAVLLLVCAVLGYAVHYFVKAYNDLRTNTSATIEKLNDQLAELNGDFSESNNKSADTLQKIAETLVTLSGQIGKR